MDYWVAAPRPSGLAAPSRLCWSGVGQSILLINVPADRGGGVRGCVRLALPRPSLLCDIGRMADPLTVDERVRLHLEELRVSYREGDDEHTLVVDLGDDIAAYLQTFDLSSGYTVLWLVAPILADVRPETSQLAQLAYWSAEHPVGKVAYLSESDEVVVEHELLGDFLDREELEHVLQGLRVCVGAWRYRLLATVTGAVPPRFSELEESSST